MRGLLLAPLLLVACHGWTRTDTFMSAGVALAQSADYATTRWGLSMGCWEANPVIGPCGDRVPPEVFFPVVWALSTAVAAALPAGRWRTGLQAAQIGFSSATAYSNYLDIRANEGH